MNPPKLRSACDACSAAKLKCSGQHTGCDRCTSHGYACNYSTSSVGRNPGIRAKKVRTRRVGSAGEGATEMDSSASAPRSGTAETRMAATVAICSPPASLISSYSESSVDKDSPHAPPASREQGSELAAPPPPPGTIDMPDVFDFFEMTPGVDDFGGHIHPQTHLHNSHAVGDKGAVVHRPEASSSRSEYPVSAAGTSAYYSLGPAPPPLEGTGTTADATSVANLLHQAPAGHASSIIPMLILCNRLELHLSAHYITDFPTCLGVLRPIVQELDHILRPGSDSHPERTLLMFSVITRQIGDILVGCCRDVAALVDDRQESSLSHAATDSNTHATDRWSYQAFQIDQDDQRASRAHLVARQTKRLLASLRQLDHLLSTHASYAALKEPPTRGLEHRLEAPIRELEGIAQSAI